MKQEPLLDREREMDKMLTTVRNDMSHPEMARVGLGDVDYERLEKNIEIVVNANKLESTPTTAQIFDSSFLPPRDERPSEL